jgi:cobalt/nickel transport system permease protein
MSLISELDGIAGSGRSPWHRASALSKMLLALTLLSLAIAFSSPRVLLTVHAVAWLVALTSRLPVRLLVAAVMYPALFSLFFLVLTWNGSLADQIWLLRPLTAGLVAVWLIGTTPYPDLFAPISRVVPRAVGDALFISYRTVFTLMTSVESLMRAVKLRGGDTGSLWRRWGVAGEGLGTLLLEGFEKGERLYGTMLLRGHAGRICGCRHWLDWTRDDLWVAATFVLLGAALFVGTR